jgi:hypothetical protein
MKKIEKLSGNANYSAVDLGDLDSLKDFNLISSDK